MGCPEMAPPFGRGREWRPIWSRACVSEADRGPLGVAADLRRKGEEGPRRVLPGRTGPV